MRLILLVLADVFDELGIGHQFKRHSYSPRLSICLGVVNRELNFHATDIEASNALDCSQRFGVWMASKIEPLPIMETRSLDDQGVALPSSY
jgi:hypothetical protein